MPFIDTKVTLPLTEEKKEAIKAKYGQAISVMNKTETYLMVGFEDNYDLYFGGNKLDKGAFVSVKVFGAAQPAACSEMTGNVCQILGEELGIPADKIYVTYQGLSDWGWNGSNF